MQVELYALSDVGRKRKNNEDNFLLLDLTARHYWIGTQGPNLPPQLERIADCRNGVVLIAADGLGGEAGGEVASRLAVETVCNFLADITDASQVELGAYLRDAAIHASQMVRRQGREMGYYKLGSTLTGAALSNGMLWFVQVGDSRGYVLRDGKLRQMTKDQTLVQQLVDIGQISAAEAEKHPYKHVLIQALGTENGVHPQVVPVELRRGDTILLCSDGLSGKVTEDDISYLLQHSPTPASACQQLIDTANANGGDDNITVVVARCFGADLPVSDGSPVAIARAHSAANIDTTLGKKLTPEQIDATLPSFPRDAPSMP